MSSIARGDNHAWHFAFTHRSPIGMYAMDAQPDTFLFDRYDGELWHLDSFGKSYLLLLKTHQLPSLRLHGTRHSFASMGLTEGVETKVMSRMIGHESEVLSLSVYTHVEDELMLEAATKVDAALTRALNTLDTKQLET